MNVSDFIWTIATASIGSLIPLATLKITMNYLRQFLINDR